MNNELKKSVDTLLDEIFGKSMDHIEPKHTADAALAGVPESEDDASRGAGRPAQISDVPKNDTDGKRAGNYTGTIASEQAEEGNPEGKQSTIELRKKEEEEEGSKAKMPGMEASEEKAAETAAEKDEPATTVAKSHQLSEEEYKEFVELKKSKEAEKKAEILKKAKEEHATLIKSVVLEATKGIRDENEALKKALQENTDLIKSMASKPKAPVAITSMSALEKGGSQPSSNKLSKDEVVDIAESLHKSGELSLDQVIEISQTGYVFDPSARAVLEKAVRNHRK